MHLCRTNNQKPQYKHTKVAGKFLEGDCWENIQKKPFGTNIIAFEINWPQQRRKRSLRTLFVSIMAAFASKTPGHNCTEGVGNSVGHIHRKHCKLYKDSLQNSIGCWSKNESKTMWLKAVLCVVTLFEIPRRQHKIHRQPMTYNSWKLDSADLQLTSTFVPNA